MRYLDAFITSVEKFVSRNQDKNTPGQNFIEEKKKKNIKSSILYNIYLYLII